jgi:hypothetical protein
VKATEAVLLGFEPTDVVATMAFGYRSAFNTGLRVRLPDRILLDGRVFTLDETEEDEHGPVAYYREELPEVDEEELRIRIEALAEDLAAAGVEPDLESAVQRIRDSLFQ